MKKLTAILLFVSTLAHAEPSRFFTASAEVGGLASIALVLVNYKDIKCEQAVRGSLRGETEEELRTSSIALSVADCKAQSEVLGFNYKLMPTVALTEWNATHGIGATDITEFSLIPAVRFSRMRYGTVFDTTVGLGPTFISATYIGERAKSTGVQFSSEIGVGMSDARERLRFGVHYRHISNMGMATPNNGVDFVGIDITYKLN